MKLTIDRRNKHSVQGIGPTFDEALRSAFILADIMPGSCEVVLESDMRSGEILKAGVCVGKVRVAP